MRLACERIDRGVIVVKVSDGFDDQLIAVKACLKADLTTKLPGGVVARRMDLAADRVEILWNAATIAKPLEMVVRVFSGEASNGGDEEDTIRRLGRGAGEIVLSEFTNEPVAPEQQRQRLD